MLTILRMFCFRYAVMRSCWHDDPDRRLTFRQLHKALNKLDKEVQVQCLLLLVFMIMHCHAPRKTTNCVLPLFIFAVKVKLLKFSKDILT